MIYKCKICVAHFSRRDNLSRHEKTKHKLYPYNCHLCTDTGFSNKSAIISHLQETHSFPKTASAKKYQVRRIICPTCKEVFINYKKLYEHLSFQHNTIINMEHFRFDSKMSFNEWKLTTEKETQSRYIKIRASRKLSNGHICEEYICHRSYSRKAKTEGRKKKFKSSGTVKTSVACPSRIVAKITGTVIEADFISLHLGHLCEISRTVLSKEERAKIAAQKLTSEVSAVHGENQICQVMQFLEPEIADANSKLKKELITQLQIMLNYAKNIDKNNVDFPHAKKHLDIALLEITKSIQKTN